MLADMRDFVSPLPKAAAQDDSVDLRIELIEANDFGQGFDCICESFGRQTNDGIWTAMNPGWDTVAGKARSVGLLAERWRSTTRDKEGRPNTVILKATLPDPRQPGGEARTVAGIAIWVQASAVPGYGDKPAEDLGKVMDLEAIYPGNEAEQRYACQLDHSLHRRRIELVKEKVTASPPAVMVLDMCAVHPAFQRRGLAKQLVQWGLDEAQARGGIEAITEASAMGRHVYEKLGFRQEGLEISYAVDIEFADRQRPSNIFMRTHGP